MTMKLIDILNENTITRNEMINGLKDLVIPFEYGRVSLGYYDTYNYDSGVYDDDIFLSIRVTLDKLESDMFDKAYLAFSQKIQSLYGNQYDIGNIKLKIGDGVLYRLNDLNVDLTKYLSVATKNTLRYDKPSVEKILKGGYHVGVNMDLLPHVTDDTYDMVKKKEEYSKMVFEFLQDGTLSNGTSYKLIFLYDDLYHNHNESSGRHLDYSDINIEIFAETDKDFPLTNDEKDELKKMFKMYDIKLIIKRT